MTFPLSRRALLALGIATMATGPVWAQMADEIIEPVEISFYNYNLATAGLGHDATVQLIEEFMAANPMIKVEGVGVNANDMGTRVQTDIAARRPPDVAQVIFSDLAYAGQQLGAVPLDQAVPQADWDAHVEGMVPSGLDLGKVGDKTYALAYTFSTPMVFYNADLFREAGLDPDQPPKTWEEVKDYALTIQDKTEANGFAGGIIGVQVGPYDWLLQSVILSNGGSVINDAGTAVTFDRPETIEAVAMLRGLKDAGVYGNISRGEALESMAAGKLAMYINSSGLQNHLLSQAEGNYELRAAQMPGFGERPASPTNSGSGLVMFSQDPVKQRAAWELMKFLTSERGYTIITSKIGYLPLRTAIVDDPEYLKDWVDANPLVRPNLAQLERMEPWRSYPGTSYRQVAATLMEAAEQAVFGDGDVAEIMQGAQARAQAMMPGS